MEKRDGFTKTLAILGTVLVWIPILAPFVFGLAAFIRGGRFLFDYFMPFELFPAVLAGGGLLLWAAIRARSRKKIVYWGLGITVSFLVLGLQLAKVTGLASGERESTGIWWVLVAAMLAVSALGVVLVGVSGVLLLRDLYKRTA